VSTTAGERPHAGQLSAGRLGAGRYLAAGSRPESAITSVHELTTADGATVRGVLATVPGATTVVSLMHPRQDLTHHPLVPLLLQAGAAVWTQHTRSAGNDLTLVHEQAILDAAAGLVFLRERGFGSIVTLGHSGGGTLYAFYLEQAGLAPSERIAATPGGRPAKLADAEMPLADGAIFLAPHPGQGQLLLACIDPSVGDEQDPMSVVPDLDPYRPANGFAEPPASSAYTEEFLARYRTAQRDRVARIDAVARGHLARTAEARTAFGASGNPLDRRRSLAPRIITGLPHRRRPAHRRPVTGPQRTALRIAFRQAPRPDQLRPDRLRPAHHPRRRGCRPGPGSAPTPTSSAAHPGSPLRPCSSSSPATRLPSPPIRSA
jgi:hypothetical protein